MNEAKESGSMSGGGKLVYRYLNEQYGFEALQTKEWKIGRLMELNDPMDCRPLLTDYRSLGTEEADEIFERNYLDEFRKEIGLISYSARIDDPAVWSHYADSHKGLALGFAYEPHEGLFEVKYPDENTRPKLDYRQIEEEKKKGFTDALLRVISMGFVIKAKSWRYEEEFRHFLYLSAQGCLMRGPHYFRGIPMGKLRRVVLGVQCRFGVEDVRRVLTSANRGGRFNVEVVKAKLNRETYVIDI